MNTPDDFSQYHAELLEGIYDCVDRIVLNAFFPMGQTGSGMRTWWRHSHGDDWQLDDKHLRELAGTFARRLLAFCAKQGIPIIEARSGERKHELAEPHVPKDPTFCGLFFVIRGNAPIWEVKRNGAGCITEVRHRRNWPYVKHYYFHIMDREWGHVTIRMCGYPPFAAQLILNGHEWVEREARRKRLTAVKDGNCFAESTPKKISSNLLPHNAYSAYPPDLTGQQCQIITRRLHRLDHLHRLASPRCFVMRAMREAVTCFKSKGARVRSISF
jgi:hypothetical protein